VAKLQEIQNRVPETNFKESGFRFGRLQEVYGDTEDPIEILAYPGMVEKLTEPSSPGICQQIPDSRELCLRRIEAGEKLPMHQGLSLPETRRCFCLTIVMPISTHMLRETDASARERTRGGAPFLRLRREQCETRAGVSDSTGN
jgi:hypothetical protein